MVYRLSPGIRRVLVLSSAIALALCSAVAAQTGQPAELSAQPPPATSQPTAAVSETKTETPAKPPYYAAKGWAVKPVPEPPAYVKPLSQHKLPGTENINWFDLGIENRTRFERRDDDYRQTRLQSDNPFLMQSRAYFGVHDILDPFRFGVEFMDARIFNSDFPDTVRDVDEADFLQAFGELYFKDAIAPGYPLAIRAGRMTLGYLDNRIIARSQWTNAINSFDGFRLRLGETNTDWQFDFFAVQPVDRRIRKPDRGNEEQWFYGLIGTWRRWHQYVTLEPYYLIFDEDRKDAALADREFHTLGLRGYGPIAGTNFDYDLHAAFQFGDDGRPHGGNYQRAFATSAELGYSFAHAWKPRLSVSNMYSTGDRDPRDGLSERFFGHFPSGHMFSESDFFSWQNVMAPKIRLELKPTDKLRFMSAYGAYWLASDSDAWVIPGRRDPNGHVGDFIGQEIALLVGYQLDPRVDIEAGYSYFMPGSFVENVGPTDDSDFFYVQTRIRL